MDNREPLITTFPSNTKTQKNAEAKKPQEKIIIGSVKKQKRGLGKKLAETFLEDDTKSVGGYIFWDVMIPAAKSMICDMVGWGGMAEMLLFGSTKGKGGSSIRRDGNRSYTNYGSYSSGAPKTNGGNVLSRNVARAGRARHDFDDITLETRGEAEDVLSRLADLTQDYGQATVADLYDFVGLDSNFTDHKYGWVDLHAASVNRTRDGYLINLPRPQPLD